MPDMQTTPNRRTSSFTQRAESARRLPLFLPTTVFTFLFAWLSAQAGSFFSDFNSGLPAGTVVYGTSATVLTNTGWTNSGCLQLTPNSGSESGTFVITNNLDGGTPVLGFLATFKAYIGPGTGGADGVSFNYVPDLITNSPLPTLSEEGSPVGFVVEFDTYKNPDPDTIGIDLKWDNYEFVASPFSGFQVSDWVDVTIAVQPDGIVSVLYDGTWAYTNSVYVAGFWPAAGLVNGYFALGARTGGAWDSHLIDNLTITTFTNGTPYVYYSLPAGRSVRGDAPLHAEIKDYNTQVDPNSVTLALDGNSITNFTLAQAAGVTTINWTPTSLYAPSSYHTAELTYADNGTPPKTNTWTWNFRVGTYTTLPTNLVAASSLVSTNPGFALRISQIDANRGPTIQRAENQLAGLLLDPATGLPYTNRATIQATNESYVINYSTLGSLGDFPTELPNSIPGLPGLMPDGVTSTGDTNAALDAVTYLYLTAGNLYTFGVNSCDGFQLTAASTPDLFALVGSSFDSIRGPTNDTLVTFGVAQTGYYPFRLLHFVGGLELVYPTPDLAALEFFTVDAIGTRTLINDTNTAGYVPAYLPAQTLPYIRSVSPAVGLTGVSRNAPVDVTLVDGNITVQTNTIQMWINGAVVAPTITTSAGITTVHYVRSGTWPLNSTNTVQFAFTDSASNSRTNSWQFAIENVLVNLFVIPPASATNATWAKWVNSGGLERGIAYNPKTGHVLIVSRGGTVGGSDPTGPNGGGIGIFDGTDGHYIGQLNKTLPDGSSITNGVGLYKVNMIDIADDGVIYVCPLDTSWSTLTFNIYRWQDESASPTICVASPQLGVCTRVGDDFCVRGSGAGTEIIASGNSAVTNISMFTTVDGTNFTGTPLNITSLPANTVRLGLAFGCGNTIYGKTTGSGNHVRYVSFTGPPSTAGNLIANYPILDGAGNPYIGPLGVDILNQRLIGASTAGTGGAAHSMNLFDLDTLVAGVDNRPIDSKPFAVNVGTFGTGSVDFTPDGSRVYTLDSGSGVIAFSLNPKLGAPTICAQPRKFMIWPTNSIGFMDVGAIGAPQVYQWRLFGTNLAGATSRTLDIRNVQQNNLGWYSVVITNPLGSVTSSVALLDIQMVITNPPVSLVATQGTPATFSVGVAGGALPLTFQWMRSGTNIANATDAAYTIPSANYTDAAYYGYSVVITDAFTQTVASAAVALNVVPAVPPTPGTGTGLLGIYYNNVTYTNATPPDAFIGTPALTRVDPTVDFDWGSGSPDPVVSADYFQVRWVGQVQPLYSQTYLLFTTSDDGQRLWVNGQKLVDDWSLHGPTERSASMALTAGQQYDLTYEFFEKTGGAVARLWWWSPSEVKAAIPMTQLYPGTSPVVPVLSSALSNGTNLVVNWTGTFVLQSATNVIGPWTPILTNIGPYTVDVGSAPQMFFRLQSE